jgi:hypothetical protein
VSKAIVVGGWTLSLSGQDPAPLTYNVTGTATTATRTRGRSRSVVIKQIDFNCTCSGTLPTSETYVGSGRASLMADTQRVKCEGQPIILEGDQIGITCHGTATAPTTPPTTRDATASVIVAVNHAGQQTVLAGKT